MRRGGLSTIRSATSAIAEVALRTKVFRICCALIALRFQLFFSVNSAILYIEFELNFVPFDRNINKGRPSLAIICSFWSQIAKNAVFALCCEIHFAEGRLRFNLVRKCRFAIAELCCASTESKSSLRKLRCASEIKKIKSRILRCAFG